MSESDISYHPHPEVISTQLEDDETVLLSLETQHYYSLNETGSRVWELLAEGHTVGEIAEAITREWDTDHDEALAYVQSFLEELREEGLVETVAKTE